MKSIDQVTLLQIISRKGDLSSLLSLGYSFADLIIQIRQLKGERFLVEERGNILITESGERRIKMQLSRSDQLILPDIKSRIPKLGKNEIFVPDRDHLNLEP